MASQDKNLLLNDVLIGMARGFLQYVAECWPWVSAEAATTKEQMLVLAARQRQDAAEIVQLLVGRDHIIDFGSFPTEYTDLHFASLERLMQMLLDAQQHLCCQLEEAVAELQAVSDTEAAQLLTVIGQRQKELIQALVEIRTEMTRFSGGAAAAAR